MVKKTLSLILCAIMLMMFLPVGVLAEEVQLTLPFYDEMESASIVLEPGTGSVSLTQDRMAGDYAVKVECGDNITKDYVDYTLATASVSCAVYKYSQISLWVKPGAGAQWIEFWADEAQVKNDLNQDGRFSVGQDLISGQWNMVVLDLTKTSNLSLLEISNLRVKTNEFSLWYYDSITSVFAPTSSIEIDGMINSQTIINNNALQFKSSGTNTFNTTPTIVTSNNYNVPACQDTKLDLLR